MKKQTIPSISCILCLCTLLFTNSFLNAQCFTPAVNYAADNFPNSICTSDFNGDGFKDLAVSNRSSSDVSVLFGDGTGIFADSVNYEVDTYPNSICTADFNSDGYPDLVTANYGASNLSILMGNSDGTFEAAVNFGSISTAYQLITSDFNNDGFADLAMAQFYSNVSILLGDGTGDFAPPVNYVAGISAYALCTADFNDDGFKDLAVANFGSDNISILLGEELGTFASAVNYSAGTIPVSISSADFNDDGFIDVVAANKNSHNVSVYVGDGTGSFEESVTYAAGSFPNSVCTDDFNNDGFNDIAVANSTGASVLLGNGTGTFDPPINYLTDLAPFYILSSDFNDDDKIDFAVANSGADNVSILLNNLVVDSSQSFVECEGFSVSVGDNTYSATGIYTDVLVSEAGCDSIVTTDLTINVIDISTTVNNLTITANQNGAEYQWINCSNKGEIIEGETNQSFTGSENIAYSVMITLNGCTSYSICESVTIDGISESILDAQYLLYPNPNKGLFTIELNSDFAEILIYNYLGENIYSSSINAGKQIIDLRDQSTGVYLMQIKTLDGIANKKIIIDK